MRIALTAHRFPPHLGGVEHYTGRMAEELSARGHDVIVYTTAHWDRVPTQSPRFRVRQLKRVSPRGSGYIVWPELFTPSLAREIARADVLHAVSFSMFGSLAFMAIGAAFRRPRILTCFYHPPAANPRPRLNALYDRTLGVAIANGYDGLVFHSDVEQNAFRAHVTTRHRALAFRIPSPPTLAGVPIRPGFRRRHNLSSQFLALYVGRIDRHKGTSALLRAFAAATRSNDPPDLSLAIVGQVEEWYAVPDELQELRERVGDRIRFLGPLYGSDLAAAYAESDVLVVPSQYESYGFTIVEAMSYGTPVISTRTGIAPELIEPGRTGFLFDYGDVSMLASCLREAHSRALAMRAAAAAAVSGLNWSHTISATLSAYDQIRGRHNFGSGAPSADPTSSL
jgi:glycogen synthase